MDELGKLKKWNIKNSETIIMKYVKELSIFLLVGDKFMPEIYLKQPRFMYNEHELFSKSKGNIQKFSETRDSLCIYQDKTHRIHFKHIMDYRDF